MVIVAFLAVVAVTTGAGWPTDHGDNLRSGYDSAGPAYSGLHAAFTKTLDGQVYGSPIIVGSDVIVATENDSVYAFNAQTGVQHWMRHLRTPISDTSVLACSGNISPTGITGSPAYDSVTGRIFVVTVTDSAQLGVEHEIWGLRASDGATAMNRRVEVPGTDTKAEQQRAALAVGSGNVYIGFGGLAGDCGNYKGAVVSLKTNGNLGGVAYVVPTGREAGIWAPGGPVVASNGSVYVAIGNGESTNGAYDYSDSITRLSPSMGRLDYYAPSTWASDNAGDKDLGSLTPAFTSNGFILQAGKSGTGYVVRQASLGHIGGQVYTAPLCSAFGVAAVTGATVYLPCTNGLTRVSVGSNGRFTKLWTASGFPGSPVAGVGALYTLANGNLYALSGSSGQQLGSIAVGTTTRFATPALAGNKVYVGTTNSLVAVNVT